MVTKSIGSCIDDFLILEELGRGGFATVFKAKCLKHGYENSYVAIKLISKEYIRKRRLENRVIQEIEIHSSLKHRNIVELYTTFEDKDNIYLILELCSGGSLEDFMKRKGHPFVEVEAHNILKQVVKGVRYLHNIKYVMHRDISLRNILLSSDQTVKIADFGLSTKLSHIDEKKHTMLGTPNFMSPEVVTNDPHTLKRDLWSLGCVLYALLVGKPPFDDKYFGEVLTHVVMKNITFPDYISQEAKKLISHLLEKDASKRVGINAVLEHEFFKKYEKLDCNSRSQKAYYRNGDSGTGSMTSSSVSTSSKNTRRSYRTLDSGLDSINSESAELKRSCDRPWNNKCLDTIQSSGCSYRSTDSKLRKGAELIKNRSKCALTKAEKNSHIAKESSEKSRSFGLLKNTLQTLPSRTEYIPILTPTHDSFSINRRVFEKSNSTPNLKEPSRPYEVSKNSVGSRERSASDERRRQNSCCRGECSSHLDYANKENKLIEKSGNFHSLKNTAQFLPLQAESFHNAVPTYNSSTDKRIFEELNSASSLKDPSRPYEVSKNSMNRRERSASEERQRQNIYPRKEYSSHLDYADKENRLNHCKLRSAEFDSSETLSQPNSSQKKSDQSIQCCCSSGLNLGKNKKCRDRYCRFEKPLSVDNRNSEHLLTPNCSHNRNCRFENAECSHEMACPCLKKYANLNQRHNTHNSMEILKKPLKKLINIKGLKQVTEPLSTIRLQPMRKVTRNAVISISNEGVVYVEHLKKQFVSSVCVISADGKRMCVFEPGLKCLVGNKPPPISKDCPKIEWFTFDNFPKLHFKLYFWAKKTVDILRAKTAKVTIFGKIAKCVMMENGPTPDYEMDFYNGGMMKKTSNQVSYVDERGRSYLISVDENLDQNYEHLWKEFLIMQKQCELVEAQLEPLKMSDVPVFPVIFGKQPVNSDSTNAYKENVSSQSQLLSWLKKDSAKLTSFDGVHHTCSKHEELSPSAESYSPGPGLVTRGIDDIRFRLKTDPKIIDDTILVEYKAGYQLRCSVDGYDVCFFDSRSKEKLTLNSELRERLQQDFLGILFYVKKRSVKGVT